MGPYLTQCHAVVRPIQQGENRFLPFDQAVSAKPLRHELSMPEAHCHAVAGHLDLQAWQSSGSRQLCHFECSPAPFLDRAAPVERAGIQRVSWSLLVRHEQRCRSQAEMQRTGRRDLQAVVVHREPHRTAA